MSSDLKNAVRTKNTLTFNDDRVYEQCHGEAMAVALAVIIKRQWQGNRRTLERPQERGPKEHEPKKR
jgi:hypothetical protein